ncbi:MAG: hypothetical protein FJ271_01295 [Planctomycetes bacterium]|nr:hypothetical protein [Planctomycetota bacterium]
MLRVSADKAGKKVRCPKCSAILPIPEAEEQTERVKPAPAKDQLAPPPVPRELDEPRPTRRRPQEFDDDHDDDDRTRRRQRARDSDDDDDRRDRHDDRDDGYDDRPSEPRTASAAVTLVGILNLVFATLVVVVSVGLIIGGPTILAMLTGAHDDALAVMQQHQNVDPKLVQQHKEMVRGVAALGTMVFILAGSCTFIIGGIPLILAGIGLLKRRQWGRVLTLVLGGLTILSCINLIVNNWPLNRNGWITFSVQAAYAIIVYVILLMPAYAREFAAEHLPQARRR